MMSNKDNAQSEKSFSRGLNVRVIQEQKNNTREDIHVNCHYQKKENSEEKAPEASKSVEIPVSIAEAIEPTASEFEPLKLNVEVFEPKEEDTKIIVRDVEKISIPVVTLPSPKTIEPKIEKPEVKKSEIKNPEIIKPVSKSTPKPTAKELKEKEIEKAVKSATKLPATENKRVKKAFNLDSFGWTRLVLAVSCAATAIFAIVYFVNLTSTDMSIKVAAMQSGIEASYPAYIPRGYSLSDVTSASGKVIMNFKGEDGAYTLTEEDTTWDSNGLLSNYIKEEYGDDYTVVKEQGLTLYMGTSWEAWVNGGMVFKLKVTSGSLTKKQMKTIATSL